MAFIAQSDRTVLKLAQAGQVGGAQADLAVNPMTPVTGAVAAAHTKFYTFPLNDNGTAATDVVEAAIPIPIKGKVVSVTFVAPIGITMSATAIKTVTLQKYTAGAAAATVWAQSTITTTGMGGAGNLLAFQPYQSVQADFTAANQQLAAGDCLTVKTTHGAAGVAISGALGISNAFVIVGVEEN